MAVQLGQASGRWVLFATVLGSGVALLDATVVNVALPRIGDELGGGVAGLQWTTNAYVLTLAALVLLGGSLGDRYGRRRVFLVGIVWFAIASLLCGLAPNLPTLIAARALQGVGGALLTPGSLAILQASFPREQRARAIGAWSGLGGIAGAVGPFLGGYLIEVASWRWVFLINVPIAVVIVLVTIRHVPESRDPGPVSGIDVVGAVLGAVALGGVTWALIAWPERGLDAVVVGALLVGVLAGAGFLLDQARSRHPMMPLSLFADRVFSVVNGVTLLVYAALGGVFFLLVLALQEVVGLGPLAAGAGLLPVTLVMLALSARAGEIGQRIGPRIPMTVGPLLAATATVWLSRIDASADYVLDVLLPVSLFGLGLSLTVAPLTATVLAAAPDRYTGVASGVNNAVSRAGQLLAVAALPLVIGLSGDDYADPTALEPAFRSGMLWCAGLLAVGALLSALRVPGRMGGAPPGSAEPDAPGDQDARPADATETAAGVRHCAVAGTPLLAPSSGNDDDRTD